MEKLLSNFGMAPQTRNTKHHFELFKVAKTKLSKKSLENLIAGFGDKYKPNTIGIFDWVEKEVRPGRIKRRWVVKKILHSAPDISPRRCESFYYRIVNEDTVEVITNSVFHSLVGQTFLYVYKELPDGSFQEMSSKIIRTY